MESLARPISRWRPERRILMPLRTIVADHRMMCDRHCIVVWRFVVKQGIRFKIFYIRPKFANHADRIWAWQAGEANHCFGDSGAETSCIFCLGKWKIVDIHCVLTATTNVCGNPAAAEKPCLQNPHYPPLGFTVWFVAFLVDSCVAALLCRL